MAISQNNYRFVIKAIPIEKGSAVELARPMKTHPLSYQELPLDPEYTNYADGRFTLEKLSNTSRDEMYWKVKQEIILRHTGEHPYEISGPDAEKLLQKIFTRDISKIKIGRCSYQFACYHDGGMIADGLLLKLDDNKFDISEPGNGIHVQELVHNFLNKKINTHSDIYDFFQNRKGSKVWMDEDIDFIVEKDF